MSTIKELAETCGVSEQAIRKWCARNQVAKDVAQRYKLVAKTHRLACGMKATYFLLGFCIE